jgi:hypothetical protein
MRTISFVPRLGRGRVRFMPPCRTGESHRKGDSQRLDRGMRSFENYIADRTEHHHPVHADLVTIEGTTIYDPYQANLRSLYFKKAWEARRRGMTWNLGLDFFEQLVTSPCDWCGRPPGQTYAQKTSGSPGCQRYDLHPVRHWGLDRVDHQDPTYSKGGLLTACPECNLARGSRTIKEFASWLAGAGQHHRQIRGRLPVPKRSS